MDDLVNCSNNELINQLGILSNNHEQVKKEMIVMNELLIRIEESYLLVSEELKKRTT